MKAMKVWAIALSLLAALTVVAQVPRTTSPKGAEVYIIAPKDGAVISGPVTVQFGLKGMGVAPAGTVLENTGHHHLIVDADLPPLNAPIPADANHLHFGKGQTEITLDLKPGRHNLQLLLGDQQHMPHDPPVVSKKITITVR